MSADVRNILDSRALRDAFGTFPTGVVAVAAELDGLPVGLAASSFTSISIDPPLVSLSIARTSSTWPRLRQAPQLGVTVLSEDHEEVCRQLAGPSDQRFDGLTTQRSAHGAITLDEGVSRFECVVHDEVTAGDHVVVLLRLESVVIGAGEPLVFHRSGYRKLA